MNHKGVAVGILNELQKIASNGAVPIEIAKSSAAIAQAHATLYLAEQQRIANLIAWTTANGTEPNPETAKIIAKGMGL